MKGESLIVVVALLIIGIIILKNVAPKAEQAENNTTAEENKVAYRYDIEDQNFTEIDQNVVEAVDSTINVQNVIDVSAIEELRSETNN